MLAKADFGQIEIKKSIVRLEKFIKDIYEESLIFAEDKNLRFKLETKGKTFPVFADQDKLLSLAQNLISNAIKYTPSGKKNRHQVKQKPKVGRFDVLG